MAKKQPNGAGNGAPKKAGPPEGAMPIRRELAEVDEFLSLEEIGQAKAQQADAHERLTEARDKIARLKGELKLAREDEDAHGKRFEGLSLEIGTGRRKVQTPCVVYLEADNVVRTRRADTHEVVGEGRAPTADDRQGAFSPDVAPPAAGKGKSKALPPKGGSPIHYDLEAQGEDVGGEEGDTP